MGAPAPRIQAQAPLSIEQITGILKIKKLDPAQRKPAGNPAFVNSRQVSHDSDGRYYVADAADNSFGP